MNKRHAGTTVHRGLLRDLNTWNRVQPPNKLNRFPSSSTSGTRCIEWKTTFVVLTPHSTSAVMCCVVALPGDCARPGSVTPCNPEIDPRLPLQAGGHGSIPVRSIEKALASGALPSHRRHSSDRGAPGRLVGRDRWVNGGPSRCRKGGLPNHMRLRYSRGGSLRPT